MYDRPPPSPRDALDATRESPLPASLLSNDDMWAAGAERDIGAIFRLAREYAGVSFSRLGRLCDMTPSRVSSYAKEQSRVRDQRVIERVADGLRLPGLMLGLAPRPWEREPVHPGCARPCHAESAAAAYCGHRPPGERDGCRGADGAGSGVAGSGGAGSG